MAHKAMRGYVAHCYVYDKSEYDALMVALTAYPAAAMAVAKGTSIEAQIAAEVKVVANVAKRLQRSYSQRSARMMGYRYSGVVEKNRQIKALERNKVAA